jgi:hypothetical protein
MSIAAVSSSLINQVSPSYFHQRRADLQQLSKDLHAGDLTAAQQDYNAIQTLAQNGPLSGGNAFKVSARQQDFAAVGQALQSGDVAGAQQALSHLQSTFDYRRHIVPPPSAPAPVSSGAASSSTVTGTSTGAAPAGGSEIVLNLGNVPAGEQITIGVNGSASGGEQLTVSLAGAENQNPEQITLNLAQSNQQVVLNLFNSTSPSSVQGSGISVSA